MITDTQKQQLIREAKLAQMNCYPKNSQYSYSAAVLTDKGNIYSAANYGSDTHSLTLHGEQSALAHAAAHGEGGVIAIAVTSNENLPKGEFTAPCHMCKQLLWESSLHSGLPLLIILANNFDEVKEVDINELMPMPWPAK